MSEPLTYEQQALRLMMAWFLAGVVSGMIMGSNLAARRLQHERPPGSCAAAVNLYAVGRTEPATCAACHRPGLW